MLVGLAANLFQEFKYGCSVTPKPDISTVQMLFWYANVEFLSWIFDHIPVASRVCFFAFCVGHFGLVHWNLTLFTLSATFSFKTFHLYSMKANIKSQLVCLILVSLAALNVTPDPTKLYVLELSLNAFWFDHLIRQLGKHFWYNSLI